MKLPPVEYASPRSIAEASALCRTPGARVLAGGQSLLQFMVLKQTTADLLVDINGIPGLDTIVERDGVLHIGALARQSDVLAHPVVVDRAPVLREAGLCVAQEPVRNRGTFVGSIAMAEWRAEFPAATLACHATVVAESTDGARTVPLREFYLGPYQTVLTPGEILTEVRIPLPDRSAGQAYVELTRTHNSYAIAGAAAVVRADHGAITDAVVGLTGVGQYPLRAPGVEEGLRGVAIDDADGVAAAAARAVEAADPIGDEHGSAAYRTRMAVVMTRRAIHTAIRRMPNPREES